MEGGGAVFPHLPHRWQIAYVLEWDMFERWRFVIPTCLRWRTVGRFGEMMVCGSPLSLPLQFVLA